jgi:hypothetical protein
MKSVTIRDSQGIILIKILDRKNGLTEIVMNPDLEYLNIEIRDNDNRKVIFGKRIPLDNRSSKI